MLDIIPIGTFHSDSTREVTLARMLVEKIGNLLAAEHPEIADLYRSESDPQRYIDIANQYLGEEAKAFPEVCKKAVGHAVRQLIPRLEMRQLLRRRNAKKLELLFGGYSSEAFKAHCKRAAVRRHELHSVDADAMTRGRGLIPWSNEERQFALLRKGEKISMSQIADELNQQFHAGKPVRNAKKLTDTLSYEIRRKSKLQPP